jgi:hypothetical protein
LVDESVADLRRSLGPTAWFVLEELLWRAETAQGQLQVQISTRELAAALGLNKDTVTRALARLRNSRVVVRLRRDDVTGRSTFVLRVPHALHVTSASLDAERHNARGRPARSRSADQLSLLE